VSGYGSVSLATEHIIKELSIFIDDNNINSILDIPCGDFSWMKEIEMDQINYLGADIVEDLVENNKIKYSSNNIKFCELDIIKDTLPKVDLIIVRDCFIHFSNDNILKAIINIINSKSKFLATTTFLDDKINNDNINDAEFRFINLLKSPFNFPLPYKSLDDSFHDNEDMFSNKRLSIWKLSVLKDN